MAWYSAILNTTVTMDSAGRVVLPKLVRDQLGLESGDELALHSEGDTLTLRPVRAVSPLRKKSGFWVFHTGKPLAAGLAEQTLRNIRSERDRKNLGLDG